MDRSDTISPADEDAPGEPDRDAPADGIEEQGSDELMDPDVLERVRGD